MVFPRKPLPVDDQIRAMRGYVRSLEAATSRTYREYFAKTIRRRREVPFEIKLRNMRIQQAREIEQLAITALKELIRQKAISDAIFKPSEQILVTWLIPGYEQLGKRYIVCDIESGERKRYFYRAWLLTKGGRFHQRFDDCTLCPSRNIRIESCNLPVSSDVEAWSKNCEEDEAKRKIAVLNSGDIDRLIAQRQHQNAPLTL
jgi:hypothetical protein